MQNRHQNKSFFPTTVDKLQQALQSKFEHNSDLTFSIYKKNKKKLSVMYINYLVQADQLETSLLTPLLEDIADWSTTSVKNQIPLAENDTLTSLKQVLNKITIGTVCIYIEGETDVISYNLMNKEKRSLEQAETESLVLGPKIAFTESLMTNLNIIRWRIRSTDLVMEQMEIGTLSPREVRLIYMKSIANEADVNTMRQRLLDLDVDELEDSVVLKQYLEDSKWTLFPQFDATELPDRFTYGITKGKVGIIVENSPTAFLAPTTLFTYYESTEDLYMRWNAGTAFRLLRFIAMALSIIMTPLYVAAVTYHYAIIPTTLLMSLGKTRAQVPFPPLLEALILEFMIELLREAGARLPTKIGQTIGIVGGIVIGEAAVQAGLTSNVLIILVALSALGSFTSPSYLMSVSVRLVRFPFIILAGMLGLVGIYAGIAFMTIHLLKTKSLGRPYLSPLYPLRLRDFNKVFFRSPFSFDSKRFKSFRPKQLKRFSKQEAKAKHDINK